MSLQPPRPVYLVELFGIDEGGLEWADISADLALSLQSVYWHLLTFDDRVEVSVDEDDAGQIEGVAFLRTDASILATITAYHLEREQPDSAEHVLALHQAAKLEGARNLQTALARLF